MIKEYLEYFNKNEPQAPMMLMKYWDAAASVSAS
jgi:hypothetical protein